MKPILSHKKKWLKCKKQNLYSNMYNENTKKTKNIYFNDTIFYHLIPNRDELNNIYNINNDNTYNLCCWKL